MVNNLELKAYLLKTSTVKLFPTKLEGNALIFSDS